MVAVGVVWSSLNQETRNKKNNISGSSQTPHPQLHWLALFTPVKKWWKMKEWYPPPPPTPPIWFHSGMCKRLKNKEKRQGYDPDDTTVHRNWTEKTLTFPVTICSTKSMEPPRASRAFSSTVCGKSNCGQFLHFVQFDSVQDDMYVLGKAPIHLLNPISQMFPQHSP